MCIYIHAHAHTHIYMYMHVHTHIYVYIHTHTYIYIHACTHMYIRTCMHTYVYTHMHAHTYIYIYTHAHRHTYICTYINACVHVCMYVCLCLGLKSSSKSETSVSSQFRPTRIACYRHDRFQSEAEDQGGEGSRRPDGEGSRRLALCPHPWQCQVPASSGGRPSSGRATVQSNGPGRSEGEGASHRCLTGAAGRGTGRRCRCCATRAQRWRRRARHPTGRARPQSHPGRFPRTNPAAFAAH